MFLGQGRILAVALALLAGWPGLSLARDPGRDRRIAELETYLSKKEKELSRLTAIHKERLKKADPLAKEVEKQKEIPDRNWLQQRALERNLAKLRPQLEEIEQVALKRRLTREEAFAAAAAIVSELESALEEELDSLKEDSSSEERALTVEKIQKLDRQRRVYQGKFNRLMPDIPLPVDLPAAGEWSREMAEDACAAYTAAVARLNTEREDILKEQRLRRMLAETIPGTEDETDGITRLEVSLAEVDRKLETYSGKLAELCPQAEGE